MKNTLITMVSEIQYCLVSAGFDHVSCNIYEAYVYEYAMREYHLL